MRVLGLSFGNLDGSCDITCKEALMGAEEAGADVHFIRLKDLDLQTDFNWLKEEMKQAQGLMIANPVVHKSVCGLFKMFSEMVGKEEELHGEKFVSYIGVADGDWDYFVESEQEIQAIMADWQVVDNDCCRWSKLLLMDDNKLARAHQIGVSLGSATKGHKEENNLEENKGICPVCGCNNFQVVPSDAMIRCCVCGQEGIFKMDGTNITFEVQPSVGGREQNTQRGLTYQKREMEHRYHKLDEIHKTKNYKERMEHYHGYLVAEKPIRF